MPPAPDLAGSLGLVPAYALVVLVAYLLGSIPSGLLVGKLVFGIDPREFGSKRTGATNVLRTMGPRAAIAVTVMDVLKGMLAVLFARYLLPDQPWAHMLAAIAVAVGHNWPVFVGFRGGKGVIVSAVAVAVLYFPIFAIMAIIGVLLIWRTRYVSLASISGAIIAPIAAAGFFFVGHDIPPAYLAYTILGGALVMLTHRENIARLLAGKESRIGQRVQTAS